MHSEELAVGLIRHYQCSQSSSHFLGMYLPKVSDAEWSSASTARNTLLSRLAVEDASGGSQPFAWKMHTNSVICSIELLLVLGAITLTYHSKDKQRDILFWPVEQLVVRHAEKIRKAFSAT